MDVGTSTYVTPVRSALVDNRRHEERRAAGHADNRPLRNTRLERPLGAEVWRRGSVVASWLLDLTADGRAILRAIEALDFPDVGLHAFVLERVDRF